MFRLKMFWLEKQRKKPLGRPTCNWKDNIDIHFREIRLRVIDSICLAQLRAIVGLL
jgi:hypothetical protein